MSHVRVRCTGLIVENDSILLVEYDDNGIHYNLPGGGLEPGETKHGLHLIFECTLKNNAVPQLPQNPDPHQSAVKWIHINDLDSVLLIPNIKEQIKSYMKNKSKIELIEDYQLDRLKTVDRE